MANILGYTCKFGAKHALPFALVNARLRHCLLSKVAGFSCDSRHVSVISKCQNKQLVIAMRWTSNKSKTTDVDAQTEPPKTGKELDIKRKNPYADMTTGEKVKEAGKDITYVGFIVAGIVALGGLFYYIGSELFGGTSVNSVYSKAFKRCCNDPEVKVALGDPIRAFGEETSRRRRRHVSHMEYTQEGRQHMRMKFHIQGTDRQADVNVEVVKNDSGSYGYRYLFVQLKEFPYRTIILEDNR